MSFAASHSDPSRPPHITYTVAPSSTPRSIASSVLRDRVAPHRGIVRGERAVLEHRVREQVRRRHRHLHAGVVERAPEPLQDRLALGRGRAGRHEVVVVEVHAVRAELGEAVHGVDRIERRARLVAERVATAVADRPEAEREVVVGRRCVLVAHATSRSRAAAPRMLRSVTQSAAGRPPTTAGHASRRRVARTARRRRRRPRPPPPCGRRRATAARRTRAASAAPSPPASDRVRMAWQRRHETDYIFDFWTALGWTMLTCGFYGFYVLYQLVRRDPRSQRAPPRAARRRDHVRVGTGRARRASPTSCGPTFERIAPSIAVAAPPDDAVPRSDRSG